MIVDANVLLFAEDDSSPHHSTCVGWLNRALNGPSRVGLPWPSLLAFVRIRTHPRAYARPLSPDEAWSRVDDFPKPTIVEMGGKNPAVVSRKADLEEAAEGIVRSAFGFGGQKCSANSRVYVEKSVHDDLIKLLVEKTEAITIGDPLLRENWLGPVVDQKAVDRHQAAVAEARRDGRVFTGGERLTDKGLDRGFYVEPTVVGDLRPGRTAYDALVATFPAGTLSGAPKPRAMALIDEYEGLRRGVYGGVVGYLDFAGDLDTAIAIRTAVIKDGVAHVQAGAGIVADSVPQLELEETHHKAAAVIRAVRAASGMRAPEPGALGRVTASWDA